MSYFEHDDFFGGLDKYYDRLMQGMLKEMKYFEEAIKSGELKGDWDVKPIEGPGMKGYVARGLFRFGGNPKAIPKSSLKDEREPLTDIYDEKECVKIFIEIPGVAKEDVQLDVSEGFIEVKAKNFYKKLPIRTQGLDVEKIAAKFNNGVLEINIPKAQTSKEEEKKHRIKIE
jgi:HSP20 family protein